MLHYTVLQYITVTHNNYPINTFTNKCVEKHACKGYGIMIEKKQVSQKYQNN